MTNIPEPYVYLEIQAAGLGRVGGRQGIVQNLFRLGIALLQQFLKPAVLSSGILSVRSGPPGNLASEQIRQSGQDVPRAPLHSPETQLNSSWDIRFRGDFGRGFAPLLLDGSPYRPGEFRLDCAPSALIAGDTDLFDKCKKVVIRRGRRHRMLLPEELSLSQIVA
jgi:hypothetical protein